MALANRLDPQRPLASVQDVLKEFLHVYLPASSYIVTFKRPSPPSKTTVWLNKAPSQDREVRTRARGKTIQGEEMLFFISILGQDEPTVVAVADTLRGAALASASDLASAGLRYIHMSPFRDIPVLSQPNAFEYTGTLRFTVELEA